MAKQTQSAVLQQNKPAPSDLERDLAPVLTGGNGFVEVSKILALLAANEKQVVVTSYPACNAGLE